MSGLDVFGIVGTTQAGTFRVEEAVAEGGFAVVYRAFHTAFRAPVALKCLKVPDSLGPQHQKEFLEQFRGEAELLFRLSAQIPSVVRPLHADKLEGANTAFVPFLALEWLEGLTLEDLITGRLESGLEPFPLGEITELLQPVADGLERAHNLPGDDGTICVLHRDLKPANIFIAMNNRRRNARILDFGIAKVKSAATAIVGKTSVVTGSLSGFTPGYAAPEQWSPKRYGQTGPWTDVWGLALTIVEAVTGRAPIDGDQAAMLGAVLDPNLRPTPGNLGVSVGSAAESVFTKALAVDPKHRYLNIQTFYNALRAALAGRVPTVLTSSPPASPQASSQPIVPARALPAAGTPSAAPTQIASHATPEVPDLAPAPARRAAAPPRHRAPQPRPDGDLDDDFMMLQGGLVSPHAEPPAARRPRQRERITLAREDPGLTPSSANNHVMRQRFEADMGRLARRARASQAEVEVQRAAVATLGQRIRLPAQLVAVGVVVAGLALGYEILADTMLPVRPLWVSGPLVLAGFLLGVYRLVAAHD